MSCVGLRFCRIRVVTVNRYVNNAMRPSDLFCNGFEFCRMLSRLSFFLLTSVSGACITTQRRFHGEWQRDCDDVTDQRFLNSRPGNVRVITRLQLVTGPD